MSQSRENLQTDERMDGRTEGRTDGQILFHGTLPAEAGGTKRILQNCFAVIFWQPHRLSQMN